MAKRKTSSGSGLAQSAGISNTFGGGKGGTPLSKPVTAGRKIGSGRTNAGLNYSVRTEGGNNTLVPGRFSAGSQPPLHGGDAATKTVKVKIQKPVRGGSNGAVRGV